MQLQFLIQLKNIQFKKKFYLIQIEFSIRAF
jgi:hypothetical protein